MFRVVSSKSKTKFTTEEAHELGEKIGIKWETVSFSEEEFRIGLEAEMEHGSHDPETDVIGNNYQDCGKIAWAHLKPCPKYYTYLIRMEKEHNCED